MNTILSVIDAMLCALVVVAALEYLRCIHPFDHPVLSLSFYLVAIGAFGLLLSLVGGAKPAAFSVVLHFGIVMYACARRQYIFTQDWGWGGQERRKAGREPVGLMAKTKHPPRNP